ncbi:MAG: hypothetical protein ACLSAC_22435 [Enterocloster bolteae]
MVVIVFLVFFLIPIALLLGKSFEERRLGLQALTTRMWREEGICEAAFGRKRSLHPVLRCSADHAALAFALIGTAIPYSQPCRECLKFYTPGGSGPYASSHHYIRICRPIDAFWQAASVYHGGMIGHQMFEIYGFYGLLTRIMLFYTLPVRHLC